MIEFLRANISSLVGMAILIVAVSIFQIASSKKSAERLCRKEGAETSLDGKIEMLSKIYRSASINTALMILLGYATSLVLDFIFG